MSTATGSQMMKTREIKDDDDFFKDFPKETKENRPKPNPISVKQNSAKERAGEEIFSVSANKNKGRFMDRFKQTMDKDKIIFKEQGQGSKPAIKEKNKKEVIVAKRIEETMNRGKKVNEYEKIESEVVGQKQFEKNLDVEIEAQNAEMEVLFECPEGCGRSFRKQALEKHAKACKAIFLSKAKEFKTENQRIVTNEQKLLAKKGSRKMELQKNLKGGAKKKNWKQESEKFRKMIKNNANKQEEVEDVVVVAANDPKCPHCDKRFSQSAIARHQPQCKTKADFKAKKLQDGKK